MGGVGNGDWKKVWESPFGTGITSLEVSEPSAGGVFALDVKSSPSRHQHAQVKGL